MNKIKTSVQFGAGNIGRGFMGQLFWEIGYHTIFVESNESLINLLNKSKKYPLKLLDAYKKKEINMTIDNMECIAINDINKIASSIALADVIGTAVGVSQLESISVSISEGIKKRMMANPRPIDIYLCENTHDAYEELKNFVYKNLNTELRIWSDENIGFVGMIVARMVPQSSTTLKSIDPLYAVADSYHKLPYDGNAIKSKPLPIKGMYPVNNFLAEFERKLFTYNLGHAALGYLGYLKGYKYVHDCFKDSFIKKIFLGALKETSVALTKKYPEDITLKQQEEVMIDVLTRFGNPMLKDTVLRVGRDPIRKLGKSDRIVGSINLCLNNDLLPDNIIKICAAAYNFDFPEDVSAPELKRLITKEGIEKTLNKISGINPFTEIGKKIIKYFYEFKNIKQEIKS